MTEPKTVKTLKRILFGGNPGTAFAILDAASIPDLLENFSVLDQDHICLFRGDLEPDMAEVAPYLVALEEEAPFTGWLLSQGWGRHWGIFGGSTASMPALRRHFRNFLTVYDQDGKSQYFRYYDPRVLRNYLPTCSPDVLKIFFGPISWYFAEDGNPDYGDHFVLGEKSVLEEKLVVGAER